MRRTTIVAFFLTLGASALDAQVGMPPGTSYTSSGFPGPDYPAPDCAFRQCLAVELTDDDWPDAVVVCRTAAASEGSLFVLPNVDWMRARASVPTGAVDLAPLPGLGAGGRDAVTVVRAGELPEVVSFDPVTRGFVVDQFAQPDWVGARAVAFAPQEGRTWALSSDGWMLFYVTGDPRSPASCGSFSLAGQAFDVAVLQWDGGGASELALRTAAGIRIVDSSGALVATYGSQGAAALEPLSDGAGADRAAWAAAMGASDYLLSVSASDLDAPSMLGAIQPVALEAIDYNQDGWDDLLLSHKATRQLVWMPNMGVVDPNATAFSLANAEIWDLTDVPTASAPENEAQPAAADWDLDGDPDGFLLVQSSGEAFLRWNGVLDVQLSKPVVLSGSFLHNLGGPEVLQLDVDRPPSGSLGSHFRLVTTVYSQVSGQDVDPVPFASEEALQPTFPHAFQAVGEAPCGTLLHCVLRIETSQDGGATWTSWPAELFTTGLNACDVQAVAAEFGTTISGLQLDLSAGPSCPGDTCGVASDEGVETVCLPCVPDFPLQQIPRTR